MVDVVTVNNRRNFREPLEAMHRDRKKIFVDGLKWDIPVVDGQYEICHRSGTTSSSSWSGYRGSAGPRATRWDAQSSRR